MKYALLLLAIAAGGCFDVPELDSVEIDFLFDAPCPAIPVYIDASSDNGLYSFALTYNICAPDIIYLCTSGPWWDWQCSVGEFHSPEMTQFMRLLRDPFLRHLIEEGLGAEPNR